ncbi:hypothetical protein A8L34_08550 [Bacillus sp. FJAT-27264]|uniref:hypothetical protein n=1 Tax=Paenibacillus sp. (strain DSM 101736 / FJAT-27264) TaxID=1850362 RepID=UPI000807AF45|nr:hypothetical protein [Bacillus sp. FJAT-27264]OBZ14015.1 hypothetical protein A8L34_08550 [Bacillus sp. FJAT-27264]
MGGQLDPELLKAGVNVLGGIVKDSVSSITTKISSAKANKDKDKTITALEEIITDLISDRNQLIQAVQAYEEVLITQRIADTDIEYITGNILPLLEELLERTQGDNAQKTKEALELFKPILSKELFNIVQLLGFNFKQAIGDPLTKLVNSSIMSKVPPTTEAAIALKQTEYQREVEYFKIMQDEESFRRYLKAQGRE